jgi:hypothetical protein
MYRAIIAIIFVMLSSVASAQSIVTYDVTAYGATPSDGVDDRLAINKAIDDAEAFTVDADSNQRAVVIFPRGVYEMSTPGGIPLQIEGDRITVLAEGAILTKSDDGAENQLLYIADTASDVVVDGLTVDAKYPTFTSSGEGIGINVGGRHCSLRNCVVRNTQGSAIVDQIGAEFSDFRHCKTYDTGTPTASARVATTAISSIATSKTGARTSAAEARAGRRFWLTRRNVTPTNCISSE